MLGVARMIHRQVGRNAIQPGGELGAGRIALPRTIDPQKYFLRQLFGYRLIVGHAVHEADHLAAVFLHQIIESDIVARGHA